MGSGNEGGGVPARGPDGPPVTLRRLLQGMLDDGMVARNRDGSYHPGEPLLL